MNRRGFIASILAAGIPPALVRGGLGILMPQQKIWAPFGGMYIDIDMLRRYMESQLLFGITAVATVTA